MGRWGGGGGGESLLSLRSKMQIKGKLDMCLWNTDAPGGNKVKIWQKSLSPIF